jgi:ADP-ribose pyrophosphatase YjhB (NUDIX family)
MNQDLNLKKIIDALESNIHDPRKGLPEEVFLFISRISPLINVDLLIKNEQSQTLLTWRDDQYCEPGWHIPGGIIRYKETFADRIRAVAKSELGAEAEFNPIPIAINELIIAETRDRSHFISLLYSCRLLTQPAESLRHNGDFPHRGEWMWHDSCPDNILKGHEMYRKFI